MTTRVITLARVRVTSLTTFVSVMRFLIEIMELNSTFRIKFSYYRGHIVVVLRAGWDSIRTTLSCQSVCFKGSCLPYTAQCNSGITGR